MMRYLKVWALVLLALVMAACGGGGNPGSSSSDSGSGSGTVVTGTPAALNFISTSPSDKAIVLKGAGGNGRSETAILTFKVVDAGNNAVSGAVVNFNVVPASDVTLNIASATSNSSGLVVTSVSSKNTATTVVVRGVVNGTTISSQSDQLLVTTGLATQAGFDLSAKKYSLNSGITGDSSDIAVSIVDANGNPVADGVSVAFQTDFGRVGSSAAGGCLTSNGQCTVKYTVQDPRPPDGQLITVLATTTLGTGAVIGGWLNFTATDPLIVTLRTDKAASGTVVTDLPLGAACTAQFNYFVRTPLGLPAPSGTVVAMTGLATGISASITTGTPTGAALDHLPTSLVFSVNASGTTPACNPVGTRTQTAFLEVKFTADGRDGTQNYKVTYPY